MLDKLMSYRHYIITLLLLGFILCMFLVILPLMTYGHTLFTAN